MEMCIKISFLKEGKLFYAVYHSSPTLKLMSIGMACKKVNGRMEAKTSGYS